ncbi:hypothetical protein ACHQM5_003973 [Ranunculus cassubicifolius]
MSSQAVVRKAWMVAAGLGVVGTLKDQGGLCRLSSSLRSLRQHVERNLASGSQSKRLSSSSTTAAVQRVENLEERLKQSEESLSKVMYLNSWAHC